jgi:hypothetical protein
MNKYNKALFEKLLIFDEKNNKELKRKSSKTAMLDENKKPLTPFITSGLQTKVLDKSGFIVPKSATISQKIIG